MAPPSSSKATHGAQSPGDSSHAEDHHRPGARLRNTADAEIRDIAKIARPIGHPGPVASISGAGQIGEARQLPIIVEPQGIAAVQAVAPWIVDLNPVQIGLDHRRDELTWHLQDRGIVVAAGRERLAPYACTQRSLNGRRNRGCDPTLTIEGEETALIARKDGDEKAGEQQQKQDRIMLAALRAYPISRRSGRCHLAPHPQSE